MFDNGVDVFFELWKFDNFFFARARLLPSYNPLPQIWGPIFLILFYLKKNKPPRARCARAERARSAKKASARAERFFFGMHCGFLSA